MSRGAGRVELRAPAGVPLGMTPHRSAPGIPLVLVLVAASGSYGCLGDQGSIDPPAGAGPALSLVSERDSTSLFGVETLTVDNQALTPFHLAYGPLSNVGEEAVRVDARQGDGEWIDRGDFPEYVRGLREQSSIPPGGSLEIGSVWQPTERPGVFREVARVVGEDGARFDVSREVAVAGWSKQTLAQAEPILAGAKAQACGELRSTMVESLTRHLEPDALLDLYAEARPDEQDAIVVEMVQRGTFVHELVPMLILAPIDEVRDVARYIHLGGEQPVRRVLAGRFFALVADYDQTPTTDDYYTLTDLTDVWPESGPGILADRLADGPDEGEDLAQLIDTFRYADRDLFAPYTQEILSALTKRCAGARGHLADACEQTREQLTAEEPTIGGRGFGSSSACGGFGYVSTPACAALGRQWNAIEAEAGDLRVQEIGQHVRRIAGR